MKRGYRSHNRLVMELLTAIQDEGPVGVTRLLVVVNLTHGKLQELLKSFEKDNWVVADTDNGRSQWAITGKGKDVLKELVRIDAVMQDHGLGL